MVLTGASSGLGAATARALARRGARLVLAARSVAPIEDLGTEVVAVPTDTSRPEDVERLAATAEERFGRIDAWVNNAAVALYGRLADIPLDQIRHTIDVDLFGYLYGARAAIPRLRAAGGGVLLMVGSVLAEVTFPYQGAYNIAKHGVLGMCNTLRQELRADGVSVCAVLPGPMDTPLFSHAGNHTGRALRPPPPVNRPERVAERIVRVLQNPRRQVHAGLGMSLLSWQWRLAPGLTERILDAYGRRTMFVTDRAAPPTAGNLYASDPALRS